MNKTFARTPLALALAAITLAATPAVAQPVAFELRIVHSDLDLTSADNMKIMHQRIRMQVREACALPATNQSDGLVDIACRNETTRAAVAQLNAKLEQRRQLASL